MLPARHMILLMGACAFYNGWIYNDFLSISIDMFGSCYKLEPTPDTPNKEEWVHKEGCTYPIGIDPVWSVSSNELTFVNSYKMKVNIIFYIKKLSVIIAVIQMSFGILLKGANSM
jgi:V-type H+-transporting ATPase subunit a